MYAIIETGGKQYRVQLGQVIQIEKLGGPEGSESPVHSQVQFQQVLLLKPEGESVFLGKPILEGARVEAEVLGQGRGEKIVMVKMKRRKQYRRTQGHRQYYTQVLITAIDNGQGTRVELTAEQKLASSKQFQSHLKPKGAPFHAPVLGSRKRRAAQAEALRSQDGT
jgi:large subunit ribosomal protein L21